MWTEMTKKQKAITIIAIAAIPVFIIFGIISNGRTSSSNGAYCEVCHKHYSYSDWDNCWSITYHGMCKKCHEDYKWAKDGMEGLEH